MARRQDASRMEKTTGNPTAGQNGPMALHHPASVREGERHIRLTEEFQNLEQ